MLDWWPRSVSPAYAGVHGPAADAVMGRTWVEGARRHR